MCLLWSFWGGFCASVGCLRANQPTQTMEIPCCFQVLSVVGGGEGGVSTSSAFLGLTSMVPAQGPADPPWDWKIFKLQGLVAGGRWAGLPSWGVKRCKISGIFGQFFYECAENSPSENQLFIQRTGWNGKLLSVKPWMEVGEDNEHFIFWNVTSWAVVKWSLMQFCMFWFLHLKISGVVGG